MATKLKHNKKSLFTDEEIEQYCQSVKKLLVDINYRKAVKKTKKVKEIKEMYVSSDEDDWLLSRN